MVSDSNNQRGATWGNMGQNKPVPRGTGTGTYVSTCPTSGTDDLPHVGSCPTSGRLETLRSMASIPRSAGVPDSPGTGPACDGGSGPVHRATRATRATAGPPDIGGTEARFFGCRRKQ